MLDAILITMFCLAIYMLYITFTCWHIVCDYGLLSSTLGYLRLGAMARDKGNFYEASDWFKEALQINQVLMLHGSLEVLVSLIAM